MLSITMILVIYLMAGGVLHLLINIRRNDDTEYLSGYLRPEGIAFLIHTLIGAFFTLPIVFLSGLRFLSGKWYPKTDWDKLCNENIAFRQIMRWWKKKATARPPAVDAMITTINSEILRWGGKELHVGGQKYRKERRALRKLLIKLGGRT